MDAIRAPPRIRDLLGSIGEQFQRVLGENLIGVYLHGSLAFNCFNPDTSDVDFLVVVKDRLDAATKRRIANGDQLNAFATYAAREIDRALTEM